MLLAAEHAGLPGKQTDPRQKLDVGTCLAMIVGSTSGRGKRGSWTEQREKLSGDASLGGAGKSWTTSASLQCHIQGVGHPEREGKFG